MNAKSDVTAHPLHPTHSRRLASTAIASWIGLAAVVLWMVVTVALVAVAWVQGAGHAVPFFPNWEALGSTWSQVRLSLGKLGLGCLLSS